MYIYIYISKGPFRTSNLLCAENLLFSLARIRLGTCKVPRLKRASLLLMLLFNTNLSITGGLSTLLGDLDFCPKMPSLEG